MRPLTQNYVSIINLHADIACCTCAGNSSDAAIARRRAGLIRASDRLLEVEIRALALRRTLRCPLLRSLRQLVPRDAAAEAVQHKAAAVQPHASRQASPKAEDTRAILKGQRAAERDANDPKGSNDDHSGPRE